MAEPVQTDPGRTGLQTSEGKMAAVSIVMSVLATVVPTLLTMLTDLSLKFPTWQWVAPAIGIVGLIGGVLTAFGYGNQRRDVKIALIEAQAKKE